MVNGGTGVGVAVGVGVGGIGVGVAVGGSVVTDGVAWGLWRKRRVAAIGTAARARDRRVPLRRR